MRLAPQLPPSGERLTVPLRYRDCTTVLFHHSVQIKLINSLMVLLAVTRLLASQIPLSRIAHRTVKMSTITPNERVAITFVTGNKKK